MNWKAILFDLLLMAFLSVISLQLILFSSGMVFQGDLVFPITQNQIFDQIFRYFYTWDYYPMMGRDNIISLHSLGFWVFSGILAFIFSPEQIEKIWLLSIPIISQFSMYFLVRRIYKIKRLAAIVSSLIYAFNPFVVDRMLSGHLNLLLAYSLTPLIFAIFVIALQRSSFTHATLTGILFSFILTTIGYPHQALLLFVLLFAYTLYISIRNKNGIRHSSLRNFKIFAFICLLIFPFFLITFSGYQFGTAPLNFSHEELSYLSQYSSPENVTRLSGYHLYFADEAAVEYPLLSQIMNPLILWYISGFSIALFSFLTPIFLKRNKETVFWGFVALISLVFAQGTYGLLENFSLWFYFNIPGFLAFRDPTKFLALTSLSYSILLGFGLQSIISFFKKNQKNYSKNITIFKFFRKSLISILLLILLITPFMAITYSNFGGLQTEKIPEYYYSINSWLKDQPGEFRVLWLPPFFPTVPYNWTESKSIDPITFIFSERPLLSYSDSETPSTDFQEFLYSAMIDGKTNHLGQLLSLANVKYVMIRMDLEREDWKFFLHSLGNQTDVSFIGNEGYVSIFENLCFESGSEFYVPSDEMLVIGGKDSLISLSYLTDSILKDWLVIFSYQLEIEDLRKQMESSNLIVFKDNDLTDLSFMLLPKEYRIDTNNYGVQSSLHNLTWVRSGWSWIPGIVDNNLYFNGEFRSFVSEFSLDGDFVLTSTNASLSVPFSITESGNYDIWVRVFYRHDGGLLTFFIDDYNITVDSPLRLDLKTQEGIYGSYSGFQWVKLTKESIFLGRGDHELQIKNENGLSALDDIIIAPYQEVENSFETVIDYLEDKMFVFILEAENTFTSFEDEWKAYPNYYPNASLGGVSMTYDPRYEDIQARRPLSVSESLFLPKSAQYRLNLRFCGKNEEVNDYLNIYLNDKLIYNIFSFPSDFTYTDIDLGYLPSGEYKIEFKGLGKILLDQIIIYPFNDGINYDSSLDSIFSIEPINNVTFRRLDPTRYNIESDFDEPYFLVFKETYNPFWSIETNELKFDRIIGYSFLNSYIIASNGSLSLNLEFTPQIYSQIIYTSSISIMLIGSFYALFTEKRNFINFFKKIINRK